MASTSLNLPTDNSSSASAPMPFAPYRSSLPANPPKTAKDPAASSNSTPVSATITSASLPPTLFLPSKTSTDGASTSSFPVSLSPVPSKREESGSITPSKAITTTDRKSTRLNSSHL